MRLKNIRFKITTTHLTQDSYEEIEGVAKIHKANRRIKKRMSYKGYRFTRPLSYPESKIKLQQENRRVELKVLRR